MAMTNESWQSHADLTLTLYRLLESWMRDEQDAVVGHLDSITDPDELRALVACTTLHLARGIEASEGTTGALEFVARARVDALRLIADGPTP